MNQIQTNNWSLPLHQTSEREVVPLGSIRMEQPGRVFVLCKNGAVALAAGKNTKAQGAVANHINRVVAKDHALGVRYVEVAVGATEVTQNQYKGGLLQINDADGEGHQIPIEENSACGAGGITRVKLAEYLPVGLVAATSEVSLIPSVFSGITIGAENGVSMGIPVVDVPAGHYYWSQVRGPAVALMSGTPATGTMLVPGANGALAAMDSTLDIDDPVIGVQYGTPGVAGEYKPVMLAVPGF